MLTNATDEERSSSDLSGSEARPNTPMPDPFQGLDPCTEDGETETDYWPSRTLDPTNQTKTVKQCGQQQTSEHRAPSSSKLKFPSSLPRLVKDSSIGQNQYKNKLPSKDIGPRYQSKGICAFGHPFDLQKNSTRTPEEMQDSPFVSPKKSAVSLPKIDTYCISHARPNTNHGFSYMVSATDLMNVKNITPRSKPSNIRIEQTFRSNRPENGFLRNSSNLYLLFRAPSRVCGLKPQPLTVRTKPKVGSHFKRGKHVKESKELKTNVVRLPDINEDVWK